MSDGSASEDHVSEAVMKAADAWPSVPRDLVERVLTHETAVQFDEKRYEASSYIRGLVVEYLDRTGEAANADS